MSNRLDTAVRSHRRRLHLAWIRIGLLRGFWAGGISLAILGAVHRWLLAVPTGAALGLGAAVGLVVLGWSAVRGRPTLDQSARSLDRALGARELLVSAWEIHGTGGEPFGARAIVMQRAAAVAAACLDGSSVMAAPATRRRYPVTVPLVLALAGVFLLLNRGAGIETAGIAPSAALASDENETPDGETLTRWQSPDDPNDRRRRPTAATDGVAPPDPLDDDDDTPKPLLLPDPTGALSRNNGELGKLAGDGAAAPRSPGETAIATIDVRVISIATAAPGTTSANGADAVELDAGAATTDGATISAAAAARASTLTTWNRLTAGERELAGRYFGLGSDTAAAANAADHEGSP